jgi:hypothetical protein
MQVGCRNLPFYRTEKKLCGKQFSLYHNKEIAIFPKLTARPVTAADWRETAFSCLFKGKTGRPGAGDSRPPGGNPQSFSNRAFHNITERLPKPAAKAVSSQRRPP